MSLACSIHRSRHIGDLKSFFVFKQRLREESYQIHPIAFVAGVKITHL